MSTAASTLETHHAPVQGWLSACDWEISGKLLGANIGPTSVLHTHCGF